MHTQLDELPRPLGNVIGRDAEVGDLAELLAEHRFVALVGLPGMGRHRVAVEAAYRFCDRHSGWVAKLGRPVEPLRTPPGDLTTATGVVIVEADAVTTDEVIQLLQSAPKVHALVIASGPVDVDGSRVMRLGPVDQRECQLELVTAVARRVDADFNIDHISAERVDESLSQCDGVPAQLIALARRWTGTTDPRMADSSSGLPRPPTDLSGHVSNVWELATSRQRRLMMALAHAPGPVDTAMLASVLLSTDPSLRAATGQIREDLAWLSTRMVVEPSTQHGGRQVYMLAPVRRLVDGLANPEMATDWPGQWSRTLLAELVETVGQLESETEWELIGRLAPRRMMLEQAVEHHVAANDLAGLEQALPVLVRLWASAGGVDGGRRVLDELDGIGGDSPTLADYRDALTLADLGGPGTSARAVELVDRLDGSPDAVPPLRLLQRAVALRFIPGQGESVDLVANEAVAAAAASDDRWLEAEALLTLAIAHRDRRDGASTRATAVRAARSANQCGHRRVALAAEVLIVQEDMTGRPPSENDAIIEDLLERCIEVGDAFVALQGFVTVIGVECRRSQANPAATLSRLFDLADDSGFDGISAVAMMVSVAVAHHGNDHFGAVMMHRAAEPYVAEAQRLMHPDIGVGFGALASASWEQLSDDAKARAEATGGGLSFQEALDRCRRRIADQAEACAPDSSLVLPPELPEPLTNREQQVLAELVLGKSNKEIGVALGITPKTVMHHTSSMYRKLGVRSRAEAIAMMAAPHRR